MKIFKNIGTEFYKHQIEISELRYQLRYRLKVVLHAFSEDFMIIMIDVQTDPIKHLPIKNDTPWDEYVNKYRFPIQNIISVLKF